MSLVRRLFTATLILLSPGFAAAQPSAEEQARRLLADGRRDLAEGRVPQGVDAFQTIVTGFPESESADNALFELGRYAQEVERDPAKAREIYSQIARKYPQGDAAPGAYLQMGRIAFAAATSQPALDEALANFQRVIRLYPESAFVPDALVASAVVLRRAGRFDAAIDAAQRAVLDHPSGEVGPEAQFELAQSLVMAGEVEDGMEAFQRVRSRYPDSVPAAKSLNAATALYRLYGNTRPVFTRDQGFSLPPGDSLKDVRSLAVTADGVLWMASNKTKSAVSFDPRLVPGPSLPADDPQTLTVSPAGDLVFAARLAVKLGTGPVFTYVVPTEKAGQTETIDRIGAATVLVSGETLISDLRRKRVLRFSGRDFVSVFPDRSEREVVKLVTTPRGDVVTLRKDDKSVEVFDPGGDLLMKLGPRGAGFEWKKPSDVAVDAFSNLYVADEDQGVFVFSNKGELMTTFGAPEVRKSAAIAIDPTGAALVYDDRAQTVVRFK